jgi:hypothetical protein
VISPEERVIGKFTPVFVDDLCFDQVDLFQEGESVVNEFKGKILEKIANSISLRVERVFGEHFGGNKKKLSNSANHSCLYSSVNSANRNCRLGIANQKFSVRYFSKIFQNSIDASTRTVKVEIMETDKTSLKGEKRSHDDMFEAPPTKIVKNEEIENIAFPFITFDFVTSQCTEGNDIFI